MVIPFSSAYFKVPGIRLRRRVEVQGSTNRTLQCSIYIYGGSHLVMPRVAHLAGSYKVLLKFRRERGVVLFSFEHKIRLMKSQRQLLCKLYFTASVSYTLYDSCTPHFSPGWCMLYLEMRILRLNQQGLV